MGSLCSKSSTHEGGHTVLGSGPNSPVNANSGAAASRPSNPRLAAAEAAERRLQAVSTTHPERLDLLEQLYRLKKGVRMKQTLTRANLLGS